MCDGESSRVESSHIVFICCAVKALLCMGEGQVNIQLTRVSVHARHCRETTEALMYAINSQGLLPAVLEGIRSQKRPSSGVHRMLTTRRAVHRRNVPILRASREWQAVHTILLHITHARHAILWRTRKRRQRLILVILRRWRKTSICEFDHYMPDTFFSPEASKDAAKYDESPSVWLGNPGQSMFKPVGTVMPS